MEEDQKQIAERYLHGIEKVVRGLVSVFRREAENYQVTWPQYHMLKIVKDREVTTVTELSNAMMVAAPTASRMVDALCEKKLVSKHRNREDHRVVNLKLTEKSRRIMDELVSGQTRVIMEVLEGEDEGLLLDSISQLDKVAEKLTKAVQEKA